MKEIYVLRNKRILALRGKYSYSIIADMIGCSRHVVAGVCWRSNWDPKDRIDSPNSNGSRNKCGVTPHGPGEYAPITLRNTR